MVLRRIVALVVAVCVVGGSVRDSYADVASGAVTGRSVFTLSAAGAAKLGLAESQIAAAVRVLGMLGRLSGTVTVGFVAYEVASALWDWWQSTYDSGAALGLAPAGPANFGVTSGAGVGDCIYGIRQTHPSGSPVYYIDINASSSCPGGYVNQYTTIGQSYSFYVDGQGWGIGTYFRHFIESSGIPTASTFHNDVVQGESGRADLVAAIDLGKADLTTLTAEDQQMIADQAGTTHPWTGPALDQLTGILDAARAVISGGVELTPGDYTASDPAASTGTMPGEIPGAGESTSTDTAGALAAVAAAIAASSAAVVAAVGAIPSAVAAAGAATVSAVQALQAGVVAAVESIPAAIAASQAAVVSAVQAIPAAIADAKTAIVAAIQAQPMTGAGSATEAINSLAADEAARDQAAEDEAAAAPAPDFVCAACTRVETWSTLMQSWQTAAAGAPIFALISRLAWPGVGSVQRTWSVGSWRGHDMTINLDDSGIGTVITVVRFVVVGGAVIVAYMIIFA